MLFHEFLHDRQKHKMFVTAKDHFEALGGEKKLSISLRHFQQICSGARKPSEHLLAVIFDQIEATDQKRLVLSYCKTVFGELGKTSDKLLSYLEEHLSPAVEGKKTSVWDTAKSAMFLNVEQMNFLAATPSALALYQKAILYGKIDRKTTSVSDRAVDEMVKLGLLTINGGSILPSRTLFRIPTYENSSSSVVKHGTDLILKIMDLFLSREGHPNQKLHMRIQFVSPSAAERILEQLDDFNKWVQSLAIDIDNYNGKYVPLFLMGHARKLEHKDL